LETFRLDQVVVGFFLSPAALGIYVASLAFTNLPRFIAQSLSMVAMPYVASRPDRHSARRASWRFFGATLAGAGLITIVLVVTADMIVPLVFGEDFHDAVHPTRLLLFGALLFSVRRIVSECLRAMDRPGIGTIAEVTSWIVLVPLVVLLAPRWELDGVAAAVAISAAVSLIAVIWGAIRSEELSAPSTRRSRHRLVSLPDSTGTRSPHA
jgi:O-antigen/teichoic acid export membrane protein